VSARPQTDRKETPLSDLGLTHIALPVMDLEASAAFYGRFAAMEVIHRRPEVLWLSDRTRPFALVLIRSDAVPHPLLPLAHLGVGVSSRSEVDRLCTLAAQDGCLLRPPEDAGSPVGYWALIRDPDGHTLEVAHGQQIEFTLTGQ
jgi:catechol 2,3-dioxygenase-like lactoylglutathione lyase family enzyme